MSPQPTLKDRFDRHVVASAAQLLPSYPILALSDMHITGTTVNESLIARGLSTTTTLLGAGLVFDMVREGSLDYFGAEQGKGKTLKTGLHDACYNAAFTLAGTLPFYLIAGVTDGRLLYSSAAAATYGFMSGPIVGVTTDILKDWCGIEPCPRLHEHIRNRTASQKKGLAALLFGLSLATTSGIYATAPTKKSPPEERITTADANP